MNLAFYRTLDASIGRWWQVDPEAESFLGMSPYNSMFNTPFNAADPNGDSPALIGGVVGAAGYTVMTMASNWIQGEKTFANWNWGKFAGAVASGMVGGYFNGALAVAGIGGFKAGLINGGISTFAGITASTLVDHDNGPKSFGSFVGQVGLGALSSAVVQGAGALIQGRNAWDGSELIDEQVAYIDEGLPFFEQDGDANCTAATGKMLCHAHGITTDSNGDPITQEMIRAASGGGDPDVHGLGDITVMETISEYGLIYSRRDNIMGNMTGTQFAEMHLSQGHSVALTIKGVPNHMVAVKKMTIQTYRKVNGDLITKKVFYIYDPEKTVNDVRIMKEFWMNRYTRKGILGNVKTNIFGAWKP